MKTILLLSVSIDCSKLSLFKQKEKYHCWQQPPPPRPGKAIGLMVTKAPILVVHTVKERMRIRYTVSNMPFLHFESTSRRQKFNQEESTKSIWVSSTIPNQPPVEKKNFPYTCLVTHVCGTICDIYTRAHWVYSTKKIVFMMTTKFHVVVV